MLLQINYRSNIVFNWPSPLLFFIEDTYTKVDEIDGQAVTVRVMDTYDTVSIPITIDVTNTRRSRMWWGRPKVMMLFM